MSAPQGDFLINETKVGVKSEAVGGRIKMTYDVDIVCEVITLNGEDITEVNTDSLKADIAAFIDEKLTSVAEKFRLLKVDALESTLKVKRYNPKLAQAFDNDSEAMFNVTDYDINVEVVVVRNGVMY